MTFRSYAQNFEDVILWRALKHVENGFYIDIGANHPENDSVSLAFYEAGWHGIHVEPMSECAAALRAARPEDKVIEAAIACDISKLKLFEFPGTGMTTRSSAVAAQHEEAGNRSRTLEVEVRTLASVLDEADAHNIHWLKMAPLRNCWMFPASRASVGKLGRHSMWGLGRPTRTSLIDIQGSQIVRRVATSARSSTWHRF